eukprot:gnl/TRDRNA2_/TRDRNA2_176931_c0_seq14.p1 gnl/TRDRNA2_/TRDRNA2_176931_c0~~gnl/TRDRNA2_/TRDRNA2_176931_c0_seq14.p1  ORF type:complete len:536 (+),score=91.30 gnl/TRDRNA2_/TRDRNA2_176931_c0_seq14:85-1692(+)
MRARKSSYMLLASALLATVCYCIGAAGECSSGSCSSDDGLDVSEFMQKEVVASIAGHVVQSPSKKVALASLKKLAGPNEKLAGIFESILADKREQAAEGESDSLDPKEQANMETIKKLVNETLIPSLFTVHDDAQKELNKLLMAIEMCNADAQFGAQSTNIMASSTSSLREDHKICRAYEKAATDAMNYACDDLDNFLDSIVAPPTLSAAPTVQEAGDYMHGQDSYHCPSVLYDLFEKKNESCANATAMVKYTHDNCGTKQSAFESEFCEWFEDLNIKCITHDSCYDAAVLEYTTRKQAVENLVPQWKSEYTGLEKIKCYVEVWMSDSDVTTVDQQKVTACDAMIVDTSPMNITYGEIPDQWFCDQGPVENHPGTQNFAAMEYSQLESPADPPTVCTDSAATTTNTTTMTTTTTTTAGSQWAWMAGLWHVTYTNGFNNNWTISAEGEVKSLHAAHVENLGFITPALSAEDTVQDTYYAGKYFLKGHYREATWEYVWFEPGSSDLTIHHFNTDGGAVVGPSGSPYFCCEATAVKAS